jgi:hypothetical protein
VSIAHGALAALADGTMSSDSAAEILKAIEALVNIATTINLQPQIEMLQQQITLLVEAKKTPLRALK